MRIQKTHVFSLAIASLIACAIPTFAQQLGPLVLEDEAIELQSEDVLAESLPEEIDNRFRIGIDCGPAPEALRVHLRLHDDSGVMVNSVMGDSPAGRAGIKRFDIIVEADGRPISSVADLVTAVNRTGSSEMRLAVIHEGKEQLITVTPEERDPEEIERIRNGFARRLGQNAFPQDFGIDLGEQIQEQLEQAFGQFPMPQGFPQGQFGFRRINPGILLDRNQLPNGFNLKMQVERNNNGPATIKIERGDDKWEVTENDLDQLPADVRPMVENMLNGGRMQFRGLMPPQAPAPPAIPRRAARPNADPQLQKRFDGLELKMQELQDAIRSIQGDR